MLWQLEIGFRDVLSDKHALEIQQIMLWMSNLPWEGADDGGGGSCGRGGGAKNIVVSL